jgi:hypothetical protein
MSKIFPEMYDRPSNGAVAAGGIYWVVCYFMIPFVTQVLAWAFSTDLSLVGGVDIVAYAINFLCMLALFRPYLADSFWNISLNKRGFIAAVFVAAVLILLIESGTLLASMLSEWDGGLHAYPISETSVVATTGFVVISNPLLGTLCMTLLTPVTVSCMFYATVFGPIANKHRVLAYVVMAVLLLLPRLLSDWWLDTGNYDWTIYLLQLPVHLIACWSYQKTNTIWAPIISLAVTNLLMSLLTWGLSIADLLVIQ